MFTFICNLLIAILWLLLSPSPSVGTFVAGFILGFGLLVLFRPVLPPDEYVRRVWAFVRFVAIFGGEFLLSNLAVARAVLLQPVSTLRADFVMYDSSGLRPIEVLLLSHLISLTPGTVTVEIAPDYSHLLLHVLDATDPEAVCRRIQRRLCRPLLEVTR
jgi:multisubunit Na+/H+ antiporter MnhE subunit